jgi:hypothetical protein
VRSVTKSQTNQRVLEHITGPPLVQRNNAPPCSMQQSNSSPQESNSSEQYYSLSSNDEVENTFKSSSSSEDDENTCKKRRFDTVDKAAVLDGVADSLSVRHTNDDDVAKLDEVLPILFPNRHATNTGTDTEMHMSGRDHWIILPNAIASPIATSTNNIGTSNMNNGVSNWIILPNAIASPIATITNGQGNDTTNNCVSNLIFFGDQIASPIAKLTNIMEIDATNTMDIDANNAIDIDANTTMDIGTTNTIEFDATKDSGCNDVCPSSLKFPPVQNSPTMFSKQLASSKVAHARGRTSSPTVSK